MSVLRGRVTAVYVLALPKDTRLEMNIKNEKKN